MKYVKSFEEKYLTQTYELSKELVDFMVDQFNKIIHSEFEYRLFEKNHLASIPRTSLSLMLALGEFHATKTDERVLDTQTWGNLVNKYGNITLECFVELASKDPKTAFGQLFLRDYKDSHTRMLLAMMEVAEISWTSLWLASRKQAGLNDAFKLFDTVWGFELIDTVNEGKNGTVIKVTPLNQYISKM